MVKHFWRLLCLVAVFGCHSALASELELTADRLNIGSNESVALTLTASGKTPQGEPDLAPIAAHFEILNTGKSQESAMRIETKNGKPVRTQSSTVRITINAMPKAEGQITIAPIKWGKLKTAPLTLTINAASKQDNTAEDLFVKAELETTTPLVQQQFVLTVRAYSKYKFGNGDFGMQMPDHLVVRTTGAPDRIYQSAINGVTYLVQERQFLVFAEKSGKYRLPSVIFEAQFASNQRDAFGFARTVLKQSRAAPLDIDVQGIPKNAKTPWLPAKDVQLSAYIPEGEHQTGEPITLNLSIIAEGVMAEALPDVALNLPAGVKSYPDQPELNSQWRKNTLIATRNDKIALIPTKAGTLTIPALTLNWWDTKAQKNRQASTQPISLKIAQSQSALTALPSINTKPESQTSEETSQQNPAGKPTGINALWQVATVVMAALWVVTVGLFLWLRFVPKRAKPVGSADAMTSARLVRLLENASPKYAAKQLILWGQSQFGAGATSVGQLVQIIQSHSQHGQPSAQELALIEALLDLNRELYSATPSHSWRAQALIKALGNYRVRHPAPTEKHRPKLYPDN